MRMYWIPELKLPGKLGMAARPRGHDWLLSEIQHFAREGLTTVVSLLEKDEALELGLGHEKRLCTQYGIKFIQHSIPEFR